MRINHQLDIDSSETGKAKLTFDVEAQIRVWVIKGYHTENGIFDSSKSMQDMLKKQQKIGFSGSGTLHINGAS